MTMWGIYFHCLHTAEENLFVLYATQCVLYRSYQMEFLQLFNCKQSFCHLQYYCISFNQTVRIRDPLFHFFSWLPGRSELKEMLNQSSLLTPDSGQNSLYPFYYLFSDLFRFYRLWSVCLLKGTSNVFWKDGKYKL